jgi:hypothetical protein
VLVRRSGYVVYPEGYAGTVSGNCELAPREGLAADLDEHGLPDLLTAGFPTCSPRLPEKHVKNSG